MKEYLPYILYFGGIALRGAATILLLWFLWDIATTPSYTAPENAVNPYLEKLERELIEANDAEERRRRNADAMYKWPTD